MAPRKFEAGRPGSNNWNLFQRYVKEEAFGWNRDEVRRRYNLWKDGKQYLAGVAGASNFDNDDGDDDSKHADPGPITGSASDAMPARPPSSSPSGGGRAAAGDPDALASFRVDPRSGSTAWNQFQAHFGSRGWTKTFMSAQWLKWKGRYGQAPQPPVVHPAPTPAPPQPGRLAAAPFKPWSKNPWNDFQSFFKSEHWGRAETRRRYYLWAEDNDNPAYMAPGPGASAGPPDQLRPDGPAFDDDDSCGGGGGGADEPAGPEPDSVGDTSLQELVQSGTLPVAPEVALRLRLLVRGVRRAFDVAIEVRQPTGRAEFVLRSTGVSVSAAHPKVFVRLACSGLGATVASEDKHLDWGPLEMAGTGERLDVVAARFVAEVSAPQDSRDTLADLAESAELAQAAALRCAARRCSGTSSSTGQPCRRRTTDASGRCYAHRTPAAPHPGRPSHDPVIPDTPAPAARAGPCRWLIICSPGTVEEAGTGLVRGAVPLLRIPARPAAGQLTAESERPDNMHLTGVASNLVRALAFAAVTGAKALGPVLCDDVSEPETKLKRAFRTSLREKNSTLVVYYSGHGESSRGAWCFANRCVIGPRDVGKMWDETRAERHATARLLIISESCHSGRWARTMRSRPNIAVQASCGSDEVCYDRGLGFGGVFSSVFMGGDARSARSTAARADIVAAGLKKLALSRGGPTPTPQHATATGFGHDNSDMDAAPGVRLVSVRGP